MSLLDIINYILMKIIKLTTSEILLNSQIKSLITKYSLYDIKALVDGEGDLLLACSGVAGVFGECSSSRLISLPDL